METELSPTISAKQRAGMDSEEITLVQLAAQGGQSGKQARIRLVEQHYPWIRQRCLQILGSDADASDAAQEVIMRMYKALPNFESRSSIRTWLYTIAHHECVSLIRKRQRTLLSDHVKQLITLHEVQQRKDESGIDGSHDAVHQALDAMPPMGKEILQLRFFGEMPLDEMGAVLGISLSATKMRLYRALEQFKKLYPQFDCDQQIVA